MRVRVTLTLAILVCSTSGCTGAQDAAEPAPPRERALMMFARAYYPGRSGQIMLVPREGSIVIERSDPDVRFMHGSPWAYDTRIPLLFSGSAYVRAGVYEGAARQQDVVPTMARVLGLALPATVSGRVRDEILLQAPRPPLVAMVAVLDGTRADYFDRFAELMPTLDRLRREGAWFSNAAIDALPSVTAPGHTSIGSGAEPRAHGTVANSMFDRAAGRPENTYTGNSPRDLMVLTLADAWNLQTDGRAVIIAQGSSSPAAVGLAGHGACLFGARPIRMASYSRQSGTWASNDQCYVLPEYLKARHAREIWEAVGGTWMGHDIADAGRVRRTSLFARFEADALLSMIEREQVGADETTDLILVNFKTPDYVGHQYGPDSPELRETLSELDRQFTRVIGALEQIAPGRLMIALTADHGMPGEPAGNAQRVYREDVIQLLHDRFDREGKLVLQYEAENSQLVIDVERLTTLGHTLDEVARWLEEQPFVFAAFTEDEVRRAVTTLGPP